MKSRVLIVEDEGIVALDIEDMLIHSGYDVISTVASGEEAISVALETIPDIILMDIRLQGSMLGTEAAHLINQVIDSPIIFLTAHSDNQTLQDAKLSNPYGYIIKPFEQRNLITTMELALYKHRSHQQQIRFTNLLKSLLDNIPMGLILLDQNYRIYMTNPTGLNYIDEMGKKLPNGRLARITDYAVETLTSENICGNWQEIKMHQPYEAILEIIAFTINLFDPINIPSDSGWAIVIRNVSAERKLQKKLETQEHIASLGQFAENVTSDLVKLLKPVTYNLDLLSSIDIQFNDREKSLISESQAKLNQVGVMLERFKEVNRNITLIPIEFRTVYERILQIQQHELELDVDESLYSTGIKADIQKLTFVYKTIMDFLSAFSESDSKIQLRVEAIARKQIPKEGPHNEYVMLKLGKTGKSLPTEILLHIFEPYLVDRVFDIKLGLLLSQARLIIKEHNGYIQVENLSEGGVSFNILLPIT